MLVARTSCRTVQVAGDPVLAAGEAQEHRAVASMFNRSLESHSIIVHAVSHCTKLRRQHDTRSRRSASATARARRTCTSRPHRMPSGPSEPRPSTRRPPCSASSCRAVQRSHHYIGGSNMLFHNQSSIGAAPARGIGHGPIEDFRKLEVDDNRLLEATY